MNYHDTNFDNVTDFANILMIMIMIALQLYLQIPAYGIEYTTSHPNAYIHI